MSSVSTLSVPRPVLLRSGLILGAVLGALDVVSGVAALTGAFFAPPDIGIAMIVLGVLTLALVVPAWSGRRWACWSVVALRLLSSATGVPAFFVPGVPLAAILAAASGVVLAVVVAVLIAFGLAARR